MIAVHHDDAGAFVGRVLKSLFYHSFAPDTQFHTAYFSVAAALHPALYLNCAEDDSRSKD